MSMATPSAWWRAAKIAGAVAILTVVAVVLFSLSAVGSGLARVPPPGGPRPATDVSGPPPDAGKTAASPKQVGLGVEQARPGPGFVPALLGVCFLMALAVTPVVVWSRWRGLRAALALAILIYGQMTVLSQLETVVYLPQVSREFVARLFVFGAMFSVTLALAAVQILGRMRACAAAGHIEGGSISWPGWIWRIGVVAVLHLATYYTAGYYLAWRNPAVRAFYGGSDPGSFLLQLKSIAVGTPWMFPYQLTQGVLWALLLVLLVRMLSGTRLGAAVIAAVFLGVIGPCQLLLPNPVMPTDVRLAHLVETVVSRVMFGFVAVWLLRPADRPPLSKVPA
jgi:hypothetical protein